jgi:hypothetical protein
MYHAIDKNPVSHDYRGSVGNPSINIVVVKETCLLDGISNTAVLKLALPTQQR